MNDGQRKRSYEDLIEDREALASRAFVKRIQNARETLEKGEKGIPLDVIAQKYEVSVRIVSR